MQSSIDAVCISEDDAFTRRIRELCAMQGWQLIGLHNFNLPQSLDLIFSDSAEQLKKLRMTHPRAVVVYVGTDAPIDSATADPQALELIFPSDIADHQLLDGITAALNLLRFRHQFSTHTSAEPITRLPHHPEMLALMDRHRGQPTGLLIVQIDHAEHLYANLDPVSKTDLLGALGQHLQSQIPSQAHMSIFDAACFAIWLPDSSEVQTQAVMKKALQCGQTPISFRSGELHFSVSVGGAFLPSMPEPQALWQEAWAAKETALDKGGNHGHLVQGNSESTDPIARRIPKAIDRDEFSLVLQPQFDIAGDKLSGVETLLRWQGLEVGNLYPEHFIPVAERHGQMARVGDWVLERSCVESSGWFQHAVSPILIGVNTSPAQFHNGAIAKQIARLANERWLNPATLELELSHTDLLHIIDRHRETLYELRDTGVRIAIDNLGVGIVDTPRLLRCPADTLKIDRSLIAQIESNDHARALVEHITDLGQRFDLRTVAVGVESERQRNILATMGCTDAQGFLFAAPIALAEFPSYLTEHNGSPLKQSH